MAKRNIFDSIRLPRIGTNVFDLSFDNKLSFDFGELIPVYLEEVLPGDKFRVNPEMFIRLAPMVAPVMQRFDAYLHFFFVPNRIMWSRWEEFITGGRDGTAVVDFPKIEYRTEIHISPGDLADYLGVPHSMPSLFGVSALPFYCYQLIYDSYYRDQNVSEPVLGDDPDVEDFIQDLGGFETLMTMRYRAWRKDYFTSALPWPQRGAEVRIPVSVDTSIISDGNLELTVMDSTDVQLPSRSLRYHTNSGTLLGDRNETVQTTSLGNKLGYKAGLAIDDNSSVGTIRELRRASRLQQWLERNAAGGARYIEQILSHFGVRSSDSRLQRPEFLGGTRTPVVISEVLQTSGDIVGSGAESASPLGDMAGHGIAVGANHAFTRRFEEHGYIMGILSVIPQASYLSQLRRHFRKFDRFDYYWPEFAEIGEQAVYNWELDTAHLPQDKDKVFGYQSRYAEYKHRSSEVHGEFRDSLKYWTAVREFDSTPALNEDFLKVTPADVANVFAVTDDVDHLYATIRFNVRAIRKMPKFNNSML